MNIFVSLFVEKMDLSLSLEKYCILWRDENNNNNHYNNQSIGNNNLWPIGANNSNLCQLTAGLYPNEVINNFIK